MSATYIAFDRLSKQRLCMRFATDNGTTLNIADGTDFIYENGLVKYEDDIYTTIGDYINALETQFGCRLLPSTYDFLKSLPDYDGEVLIYAGVDGHTNSMYRGLYFYIDGACCIAREALAIVE